MRPHCRSRSRSRRQRCCIVLSSCTWWACRQLAHPAVSHCRTCRELLTYQIPWEKEGRNSFQVCCGDAHYAHCLQGPYRKHARVHLAGGQLAHQWASRGDGLAAPHQHSANPPIPAPPLQLVHMVSSGERLQVPPRESAPGPDRLSESEYAAYVALMQRCWAQEPAERPGFDQIISQLRSAPSCLQGSAFLACWLRCPLYRPATRRPRGEHWQLSHCSLPRLCMAAVTRMSGCVFAR